MSSSPILVPATPYDEAKEKSHFSRFDPGTRTLKAGFRPRRPVGHPLPHPSPAHPRGRLQRAAMPQRTAPLR